GRARGRGARGWRRSGKGGGGRRGGGGVARGGGSRGRGRRREGGGEGPTRVRRLTGRGFKRAATAKEGTRRGPHPGAASHGAEVQTSSDGGSGSGRWSCAAGRPERRGRGRGATSASP